MNHILVINVNWLGDVIFSSPVFYALKHQYPQARISCLTVPRVSEVAGHIPFVDEVIVYDEQGRDRFFVGKVRMILELRRRKFDSVFLLHGSWTRALLAFLAGIPIRVGYVTKKGRRFFTHPITPPADSIHRSDKYLHLIEAFTGERSAHRQTSICLTHEERSQAQTRLAQMGIGRSDFLVVMHVGGNWDLKRWPLESFAKLSDTLSEQHHAAVLLCGGPSEKALEAKLMKLTRHQPLSMIGQTNFVQLAAIMSQANIVVSADSGPLHIASSLGRTVVGLFGPTHPLITGPRGSGRSFVIHSSVGCNDQPCYYLRCQDNVCMKAITIKDVLTYIEKIRNP